MKATVIRAKLRRREKWVGGFASVLGIVMFISLGEVLVSNLRGNSEILFQPLATACNGVVWSLYAFGRKDWFILAPNIIAVILGALTAAAAVF